MFGESLLFQAKDYVLAKAYVFALSRVDDYIPALCFAKVLNRRPRNIILFDYDKR